MLSSDDLARAIPPSVLDDPAAEGGCTNVSIVVFVESEDWESEGEGTGCKIVWNVREVGSMA